MWVVLGGLICELVRLVMFFIVEICSFIVLLFFLSIMMWVLVLLVVGLLFRWMFRFIMGIIWLCRFMMFSIVGVVLCNGSSGMGSIIFCIFSSFSV